LGLGLLLLHLLLLAFGEFLVCLAEEEKTIGGGVGIVLAREVCGRVGGSRGVICIIGIGGALWDMADGEWVGLVGCAAISTITIHVCR